MRYVVQLGEGGFTAGQAVYVWHLQQGRYSLVSTLQASGITALFVQGRAVQVSEGEVDAFGLRPEQYWLKRAESKQDSARFIWAQNRLDLGSRRGMHPVTPQAQDLLSFPFHLAMTAREGEADFTLGVTNGRRYREYSFHNFGREEIELRGRTLETLHLQGSRPGEGSLDVWLDLGRSGLPAKVSIMDDKGKTMMLVLEEVRTAAQE